MSGVRDAVVAPWPALLNAFIGLYQRFVFQLVKRWVKSAFLEIQYAFRAFLDPLGNTITVARLMCQCFQNQAGEGSFKVHIYIAILCIGYRQWASLSIQIASSD